MRLDCRTLLLDIEDVHASLFPVLFTGFVAIFTQLGGQAPIYGVILDFLGTAVPINVV